MDRRIRGLEEDRFFLAVALSKLPWIADGITDDESRPYRHMIMLVHFGSREQTGIGLVHRVLSSPFLDRLDPGDQDAIAVLSRGTHEGTRRYLQHLLEQPAMANGRITDDVVPRLLPLGQDVTYDRNLAEALLDPERMHLDSETDQPAPLGRNDKSTSCGSTSTFNIP